MNGVCLNTGACKQITIREKNWGTAFTDPLHHWPWVMNLRVQTDS